MTTGSGSTLPSSNWPLMNPEQAPPPPNRPPPSYSPEARSTQNATSPKRRPLSSTPISLSGQPQPHPLSPTHNNGPRISSPPPAARKNSFDAGDDAHMRMASPNSENWDLDQEKEMEHRRRSSGVLPVMQSIPYRPRLTTEVPTSRHQPQSAIISSVNDTTGSRHTSRGSLDGIRGSRNSSGGELSGAPVRSEAPEPLQYHHQAFEVGDRSRSAESASSRRQGPHRSQGTPPIPSNHHLAPNAHASLNIPRPLSAYSSASELGGSRRTLSPGQFTRTPSPSRLSPDPRPMSYIDLLNVPYPQPPPAPTSLDNSQLRSSVGQNASLLSTKQTLEMYRANVKKTNDPTIQYEFAVFMVSAATETADADPDGSNPSPSREIDGANDTTPPAPRQDLLREARHILQKLSDRSYPFAQYYLADGYASGLFHKGSPDNDRAFPLFVAASKHGHAEAGYRAALCYEFGWGCRKDLPKAVQFYRQSASKNHPGAMARLGRACLSGDMGLGNRYREGIKWLKRAAESADFQYNSAPYELGVLHETGYGDDIFQDESYAAQLFTQSADLGHVDANYRLGDAYEHGKLSCPRDPALSVHFYTGAAQQGHPLAMMALCAWYMVGAEPVLEKDENEAYEWARQAAETGLPKAQYAIGYFTEMGIGCRRDPLEANVWYVKAADQGDERAKHRIAAIRAAASGAGENAAAKGDGASLAGGEGGRGGGGKKKWGLF